MRGTSDIRRAKGLDRRGHCAALGSLALALWLVQASWCPSLARADMIGIGINFKGDASGRMIGTKGAGVEPQTNWNDVGYWTSVDLLDNTGATTAVSVTTDTTKHTYNADISVDPPDGGNDYLMRGYIYPWPSGSPLTVTVAGLGPPFTTLGYDIIVCFDGPNKNDVDWVTQYMVSADGSTIATVFGVDAKDAAWNGTFVQAFGTSISDAVPGNYVRFTGLTGSGFTLTATPDAGSGPINAIQIINVPEPASLALLVLGLASALAARARRSRFG